MGKLKQKWNLDRVFKGESHSEKLQETFQNVETDLKSLDLLLSEKSDFKKSLKLILDVSKILREIDAFIACLGAQDVSDTKAHLLSDQIATLKARFETLLLHFDAWLISFDTHMFSKLLETSEIQSSRFYLEERRAHASNKLSPKEEGLIHALAVDGYHGWTQIWSALIGDHTFPINEKALSFGQIENKMADPDRTIRKQAFDSIETVFKKHQSTFSQVFNHLAGFRLATYQKRDWNSALKEPLELNRMEENTLNTMWSAIQKYQKPLLDYMKCKAGLLGLSKLTWYDLEAPLGNVSKKIPYDEAASFIVKHFTKFSPIMGKFAEDVLHSDWIDSEDRTGKYPGGFCIGLPVTKESRIFMTYGETMTNVFTLAHELGHAFHNFVIFPLVESQQHIPMNLAETASTMAELIVSRAALEETSDPKQKLFLLDDFLSRGVAFLMNIYARFLFESRFYEKRKRGFISSDELNALMIEAQKEAYGDALEAYHPLFWAAKMHFYFSDPPFYNFPYTFGYLFSMGIHAYGQKTDSFEKHYISLLEDTGRMTTEALAKKHLNVDLSKPQFWEEALASIAEMAKSFLNQAKHSNFKNY